MGKGSKASARGGQGGVRSARPARSSFWGTLIPAVLVAAIAFLAHMCASFGLFLLVPVWTTPLLVGGIAASATGASWKQSAAGTAAGLLFGVAVARPWLGYAAGSNMYLARAGVFVLLGSAAGGAVAYVLGKSARRDRAEWIAAIALVAVIVGVSWATASAVNSGALAGGEQSINQRLSVRPELGNLASDDSVYLRLFYDMHDGQPYYDSYAKVFLADPASLHDLPVGVTGYRMPTIFYLWLLLPPRGDAIPWAFMAFATLAVVSGFSVGAQLSRPGVAVLGALMIGVAYLFIATSVYVTFVDGWAMAFTLAGVALFVASVRRDSRGLLWAAVACFFSGAALREILVYPMVLAAASVMLLPREKWWREARPWLVGLASFAVLYAGHVVAIAGRVSSSEGYGRFLHGGPAHLVATLQFLEWFFGGKPWLLPVLVMVGLVGAVTVWGRHARLSAFLTAAIAAPLLAFLVVSNGAQEVTTGALAGYWGILVVPMALALVPVAVDRALVAARMKTEKPLVGSR